MSLSSAFPEKGGGVPGGFRQSSPTGAECQRCSLANGQRETVVSTASVAEPQGVSVYNFTVADDHTYFVEGASNNDSTATAANGPTVRIPSAYHQWITNAFRREYAYGQSPPDPAELKEIMQKVYQQFPLPP